MYEKIITYLKALVVLCVTVCFMLGADYKLLNTSKNIVIYCLIVGNLLIWCFYYCHRFYDVFIKKE